MSYMLLQVREWRLKWYNSWIFDEHNFLKIYETIRTKRKLYDTSSQINGIQAENGIFISKQMQVTDRKNVHWQKNGKRDWIIELIIASTPITDFQKVLLRKTLMIN